MLYRAALSGAWPIVSGFYNQNVRVDVGPGAVNVRIPIPASDMMDLSIWPEAGVLAAVGGRVTRAPRLLYACERPPFQVHEFIAGDVLDDIAPRGRPVPGHVLGDIGELFAELHRIERAALPVLPDGWPVDGDTAGFARRLSELTRTVHERFGTGFRSLFSVLGIPADPLETIEQRWDDLAPRPFRLLHTDIHRKNLIVRDGRTYFLDWELALWGDPVYDLAVHLHKMAYLGREADDVIRRWQRATAPDGGSPPAWRADLDRYLAHERVKSSIVDTVRYTKLVADPATDAAQRTALIDKLTRKLAAAHTVWGTGVHIGRDQVMRAVMQWIGSDRT